MINSMTSEERNPDLLQVRLVEDGGLLAALVIGRRMSQVV